ncbi:hypothetical protein Cgig2_019462 [Carnegiea gigantea]|uniref:Uncharacterized protein n=1 Tax=Carnegiea gigantea TaxID=171969 RepID=A0A9Q1KRB5_9CARY|nr:hypothetical protein Cgig2_019462 [Carnegiea gigantea]
MQNVIRFDGAAGKQEQWKGRFGPEYGGPLPGNVAISTRASMKRPCIAIEALDELRRHVGPSKKLEAVRNLGYNCMKKHECLQSNVDKYLILSFVEALLFTLLSKCLEIREEFDEDVRSCILEMDDSRSAFPKSKLLNGTDCSGIRAKAYYLARATELHTVFEPCQRLGQLPRVISDEQTFTDLFCRNQALYH